jgi:dethiobiotin synthetase
MKHSLLFVTGTDTGVGKTVVSSLLTRYMRNRGVNVAALKPISSGDRNDARALRAAGGNSLALDAINPWHFRVPLTPLLAARQERTPVALKEVVRHIHRLRRQFDVLIVEGAGGLLSPLGEGFDARDLIAALRATPIIVCPNRIGAINQTLLVLDALPPGAASRAQVILISQPRADDAAQTNRGLLSEFVGANRVHVLPWLKRLDRLEKSLAQPGLCRTLAKLAPRD